MLQFKPAYGHIFEEYIDMNYYTHWGYSDLDIIFGDLPRWITNDELTNYDIVTYGYGDQHRLYLRGQFTFHKNNNQTKYLYQPCTYLTHMDIRFEQISSGKKEFKLESAEGCYSQAVLKRDDINIKYAVKAMNDLSPDNHEGADTKTTHSHGVFIAYPNKYNNNSNNQTIIFKTANEYSDPKPFFWFQNNKDYQNKQIPIQQEVGDKLPIRTTRDKNTKCMYWAPQKYQTDLCIDDDSIDSTDTIFYLEGKLYKQKHEVLSFGNDDNIISYPFFHFQEWKRKYRYNQLSSFRTNKKHLDGIVLVKEGAIPLLYQSNDDNDVTTSASTLDQRIFDFMSSSLSMQQSLPSNIVYCLSSSKDGDCNYSITWQNSNILFLFKGSSWVQHNDIQQLSNDVSLILILSLSSKQVEDESVLNGFLSLISKNIRAWGMQPFVLLLHISCAETEGIRFTLYNHFHRSHDRYHPSSMIAVIYSLRGIDDDIIVSRNTLLNMAQSAARTRFVVIGLELERGMVISRESSYFSKRAVLIHGNEDTGLVFYIPQIASKEFFGTYTDGTFSVSDILEERKVRSHLFALDLQSYDCKPSSSSSSSCDDNFEKKSDLNDNIHQTIMDLWWHITSNEMNGENIDINNLYTQYFNIQKLLLELSQSNNQKQLYSFDTHPILLKDKIAPSSSKASNMNMMSTSDLVPYIEEFGGRRCYNAIHLIQLIILGYKFQLLPGAIAMSYPSSREKVCTNSSEQQRTTDPKGEKKNVHHTTTVGISRCDGCYMLSEDDSIIDDIWEDELTRSAKTAILTNEY